MTNPAVKITQVSDYKFMVEFKGHAPTWLVDEPEPIGKGEGPQPEQLLIASVANCLCASLVFALGKFRQETKGIEATSCCHVERNAAGRLRVTGIEIDITLGANAATLDRIDQVLAQFENFCTVSESVKSGIPVHVSVYDDRRARLK